MWVAFQGTRDIGQVLQDLDCRPHFVHGIGYCHHGFTVLAEGVYPLVKNLRADYFGMPITLTGHSLGGAVAILVAALLVRDRIADPTIITFGAPRVSVGHAVRRAFARPLTPIILYRNGVDIVPDLPPLLSHPAPLLEIGKPSDALDAGESDHAVERYFEAIWNLSEVPA
jgi:hypothetical protein